jgi:hypothetical protein
VCVCVCVHTGQEGCGEETERFVTGVVEAATKSGSVTGEGRLGSMLVG